MPKRALRLLLPLTVIVVVLVIVILFATPAAAPTLPLLDSETPLPAPDPGEVRVDFTDTPMVFVPEGKPLIGSMLEAALAECERARSSADCAAWRFVDETPPHEVTLAAFWLDQYEVSVGQYQGCETAGACTPPSENGSFSREAYYNSDEFLAFPVIDVTWTQAHAFCTWRLARLPTEFEWEYAARGPSARLYPWGSAVPGESQVNYGMVTGDTTGPDSHPAGASWVNAFHLTGNVWEWTSSPYVPYPGFAQPEDVEIPPEGAFDAAFYVQRGGSWGTDQGELRASERVGRAPDVARSSMGFRCAREATASG